MSSGSDPWFEHYELWLDDCLREFNERFGGNRSMHTITDGDYDPDELVEFSQDGDAYPHGSWGTGHIRHAVTPWEQSPRFME